MERVLLPVNGSRASRRAARHAIRELRRTGALDIHVLNVQRPLRRHVAQFVRGAERQSFHRDEAERALRPVREMLDEAGAPYTAHMKVGHAAEEIVDAASRLRCDLIVLGTTRKSSIVRALESSVTNDVLELTNVPVVVIAAEKASAAERYGVPAAVGAALALLLYAATE